MCPPWLIVQLFAPIVIAPVRAIFVPISIVPPVCEAPIVSAPFAGADALLMALPWQSMFEQCTLRDVVASLNVPAVWFGNKFTSAVSDGAVMLWVEMPPLNVSSALAESVVVFRRYSVFATAWVKLVTLLIQKDGL
jgi:hypothetical protein